jgi:hypothetical protein
VSKRIIAIGELNGDTLTVEVDFAEEIAKIMGWPVPSREVEGK